MFLLLLLLNNRDYYFSGENLTGDIYLRRQVGERFSAFFLCRTDVRFLDGF